MLRHAELLKLKRWNRPAIYNGSEQITAHDRRACFKQEQLHDFMPQMGPMIGNAVTLVCKPGNSSHRANSGAVADYRRCIAEQTGPKSVVPPEEKERPPEAVLFKDGNERETVIGAARQSARKSFEELPAGLEAARGQFSADARGRFQREGE